MPNDEPRCGTPGAVLDLPLSRTLTKGGTNRTANRYAGTCAICGRRVERNTGCTEPAGTGNRWKVYC